MGGLPIENTHYYTGLTGGTSSTLDGEPTVNLVISNTFRWVIVSGSLSIWQLQNSSAATDVAGGVVRPTDFNVSTNSKVWFRVLGY